ncbi:MAG: hypothetical protein JWR26_4330, partial [Pedosphaera sp.]|nr:hypothetical protein [Pedosphaera sp.]
MKKAIPTMAGCFVLFGMVLNCFAADSYEQAAETKRIGNLWKSGEPIPAQLLKYCVSWHKGSCFPDPDGTDQLFGSITNYPILLEVAFQPRIDSRIFSNAVNQAVVVAGPIEAQKSNETKASPSKRCCCEEGAQSGLVRMQRQELLVHSRG